MDVRFVLFQKTAFNITNNGKKNVTFIFEVGTVEY